MTFVRPRLEYASAVWGSSCTRSDALYLERVQNSIARTIVRSSNSTEDVPVRSSAALKHLGWPTLAWRRRRSCLRFLWQLLHGEGPPQLSRSLPRTANARCDYQLRRAESLEFPVCSSSRHKNSFLPYSIAIYNALPPHVSASRLSTFLHSVDSHFAYDKHCFGL